MMVNILEITMLGPINYEIIHNYLTSKEPLQIKTDIYLSSVCRTSSLSLSVCSRVVSRVPSP